MKPLSPTDPQQVGPYDLEGILGTGGMGTVYLGRSPGGRPAAVKVINPSYLADPEAVARFRREAAMLGTVRSAYTAALIDAELTTAPYWMATEFVPGPTLAAVIADEGALSTERCLQLLAAVAEGLADIHRHDICHRDIKPQNVILSPTGPQLIDFGLARGIGESGLTIGGITLGTPGYIAPEMMVSDDLSPAADVFALGATVTNAATGRRPYGNGTFETVYLRLMHEEIDLDGVDPGLAGLLRACTAKDPSARPTPAGIIAKCRDLRAAPARPAPTPEPAASTPSPAESAPVEPLPAESATAEPPAAAASLPSPPTASSADQPTVRFQHRKRLATAAAFALVGVLLFAGGAFAALRLVPTGTPVTVAAGSAPPAPIVPSLEASALPLPSPSRTSPSPSRKPSPKPSRTPKQSPSAKASTVKPVTTPTTGDGRCIVMPDSDVNGMKISVAKCTGAANQKWTFTKEGALMNAAGTRCLDLGGNAGADIQYQVQIWDCNFSGAQLWVPQPDDTLFNAGSGRCLGVLPTAALSAKVCTSTAVNRWRLPA
ncbi:protein kinase domain-containing protein [Actinoplanes sp. HUAS TT8]|uniref:protein kinase domain-containing protein n=1 Tax=Actinoplanes sp. HUAS TT8 TaxID=3447453 RepID=UPI003F520D3F